MRIRIPRGALALGALLAPALGGCATQSELDKRDTTLRTLQDRNVSLQQEVESKDTMIDQLRTRVSQGDLTLADLRTRYATLQSDLLRMQEDYRTLGERLGGHMMIDPVTERALRRLAEQNGNLFEFDAARGMIQLKSDLTFASGSSELTSDARAGLQQLAQVLNSADASGYDLRIVGHTDNVPISRPATKQSHPTNMHLSVHRSISVQGALREYGINSARMEVAGWGEFRPRVGNPAKGGSAANRRVEIFLTPSSNALANAPTDNPAIEPAPEGPKSQTDFPMK